MNTVDHRASLQETTTGATIGVTTEAMTGDTTGTMNVMKNEITGHTGVHSTPWVVNVINVEYLISPEYFFPLQTPITISLLQPRLPLTVPLTFILASYVKTTCSFLIWHLFVVAAFVGLTLSVFNRSLLSQQVWTYRVIARRALFLFFFIVSLVHVQRQISHS